MILEKLEEKGTKISRPTFLKLMKEENLFQMRKSAGGWYVCSEKEVGLIVQLVRENYGQH